MVISDVRRVAFLSCAMWVVYCLIAWFWFPPRSTDMIQRYAYMADAFAGGDWINAFHPRFCLLFPILTGSVVWLTGLSGDRACQFVALAGWCFSMIPFWLLFNRFFGRKVAYLAVVLGLFNVDLFFLAMEGWRDSVRMLLIALTGLGAIYTFEVKPVQEHPWAGAVLVAIGLAGAAILRVDAVMISALALFVFVIASVWYGLWRQMMLPLATWVLAMMAQSYMVYTYTGYFVPVPHAIKILEVLSC